MIKLLQAYSLEEIIIFITLLALAVKGCHSFIEWGYERMKAIVDKTEQPNKIKKHIETHQQEIADLKTALAELKQMTHLLIESDRDDIKAFLTREHHYFVYQKGWIDDYSLNCIEKRFSHYEEQGGNSFIKDLMEAVRQLPRRPYDAAIDKSREKGV